MSTLRRIVDDLDLTEDEREHLGYTLVVGIVICVAIVAMVWLSFAAFGS